MSQLENKAKKATYKLHEEDILRNIKALYTGTNVILDAFEKRVFIAKGRSYVVVNQTTRMTKMILILKHQEK